MNQHMCAAAVAVVGLALGCSGQTAPSKGEIHLAFERLQKALAEEGADTVWDLLARDARDNAEREARAMKEAFLALPADARSAYEKKSRLTADDLENMTGPTYLKSAFFFTGAVEELSESKLDRIIVKGDSATIHYVEENGDKERLPVVRERGQWRFAVPVPRAVLP